MRHTRFAVLGIGLTAALVIWYLAKTGGQADAPVTPDVRQEGGARVEGAVLVGQGRAALSGQAEGDSQPADPGSAIAPSDAVLLRVVDAEDGRAIGGARVFPWADRATDELGQVRIPPIEEPGGIEIRIECRGYVPAVRRLYGPGAERFALRRGVPLDGCVIDAASRAPYSDATVYIRDGQEAGLRQLVRMTDAGGRFDVPGIVAGRLLEIRVEIAGRAPTFAHVVMEEPTTNVEVLVASGGVLEGRVERPGHEPASRIQVFLVPPGAPVPPRDPGPNQFYADAAWHIAGAPHVQTADDGTFTLVGIPTGEDLVAVAVLGEMWEVRSTPFRFVTPGERLRLSLAAEEPAAVSVRLDPGAAEGIELYEVSIRGLTMWARKKWGPAPSGSCLVAPLAPGSYHMTAHLQGSPDVHRDVSVRAGEQLEWLLEPDAGDAVSGVVLDPSGKPQSDVMIFWRGERSVEATTASDGSFRLESVGATAGELTAVKWGPGDSGECKMKGVVPGTQGLSLVIRSPGEVIVNVVGLPPDTMVTAGLLTESGRSVIGCRLDGEGQLTCPRQGADAALLVLLAEGHAPNLIELPEGVFGESVRLGPVRFDDGVALGGRLLNSAGDPVAEADVWIAAWWSNARTRTDAEGAFRIAGMPRRRLLVGIQALGTAPELQWVEPGVAATLHLSSVGQIEGTVVSQAGVPLAGGSVRLAPVLDVSAADDVSSGTLTATTDALGRFSLAAAVGRWLASVESQGEVLADPVDVRVTDAEPSIVRLVLRRR